MQGVLRESGGGSVLLLTVPECGWRTNTRVLAAYNSMFTILDGASCSFFVVCIANLSFSRAPESGAMPPYCEINCFGLAAGGSGLEHWLQRWNPERGGATRGCSSVQTVRLGERAVPRARRKWRRGPRGATTRFCCWRGDVTSPDPSSCLFLLWSLIFFFCHRF